MALRAFVAIPVPSTPALVALLDELAAAGRAVKPVDPAQLHFTLSFLGNVAEDAAPVLAEGIRDAARGQAAFQAALRTVGAFPNARHPRVVWIGVDDPRPMVALAMRVREALAARGFAGDDKDFRAHLTLARVREDGGSAVGPFLRAHGGDDVGALHVSEVVLYKSTLGPHGPTYEALARSSLEAAA